MNKKLVVLSCCFILLSIGIYMTNTLSSLACVVQFLSLALGITILTYALVNARWTHHSILLYAFGVLILICYMILTIDTFLLHSIDWFWGIIRYPIYSLYGIAYLAFCIPGLCLCYKQSAS